MLCIVFRSFGPFRSNVAGIDDGEDAKATFVPTKILLIDMPKMLREIIRDFSERDPALDIVGVLDGSTDLPATAAHLGAAVVVMGSDAGSRSTISALLHARPSTRVLTIADDAGQVMLYRLMPEEVALGELSPARLIEAIKG